MYDFGSSVYVVGIYHVNYLSRFMTSLVNYAHTDLWKFGNVPLDLYSI